MHSQRFVLCLLLASMGIGGLGPRGAAAQPAPLGPEIRVDTVTGNQYPYHPLLGMQPGGDFEVAWSYIGGSLSQRVYARHFAADGKPTNTAQLLVGQGSYPTVRAVTPTLKGFEVLWQWGDWPYYLHYRRHLNTRGVPDPGPATRMGGVAAITPWVWQVRGNGFLAGWPTNDFANTQIKIQRLTTAGRLTGPVTQVTTRPVYFSVIDDPPILTSLADGGFLAAWDGLVGSTTALRTVLRARQFSPAGAPLGPEIDVNTTLPDQTEDLIFEPKVAASPQGDFAVGWSFYDKATDTDTAYARLFDADGRPLTPEIQGPGPARIESLAFDSAGNLLVLWLVAGASPTSTDLRIQLFDPKGLPLGPSASVVTTASGRFNHAAQGSVGWTGSSWVVIWEGQDDSPQTRGAVFVRRFAGGT